MMFRPELFTLGQNCMLVSSPPLRNEQLKKKKRNKKKKEMNNNNACRKDSNALEKNSFIIWVVGEVGFQWIEEHSGSQGLR